MSKGRDAPENNKPAKRSWKELQAKYLPDEIESGDIEEPRGRPRKRRGEPEEERDEGEETTILPSTKKTAATTSTATPAAPPPPSSTAAIAPVLPTSTATTAVPATAPVSPPLAPIDLLNAFAGNVDNLGKLPSYIAVIAQINREVDILLEQRQQLSNRINTLQRDLQSQIDRPHVEAQLRLEQEYDRLNEDWQRLRAGIVALNAMIDEHDDDIAACSAGATQYDQCVRQAEEVRARHSGWPKDYKTVAQQKLGEWQSRSGEVQRSIAAYNQFVQAHNRLKQADTLVRLKDQIERPVGVAPANSLFTLLEQSRDQVRGQWITQDDARAMMEQQQKIERRVLAPSTRKPIEGAGVDTKAPESGKNVAPNTQKINDIKGAIRKATEEPISQEAALMLERGEEEKNKEEDKVLHSDFSLDEENDDERFATLLETTTEAKEPVEEDMSPAEVEKAAEKLAKKSENTDKQIVALEKDIAKLKAEVKAIEDTLHYLAPVKRPSSGSTTELDQQDRIAIRERKSLDERYQAAQKQILQLHNEHKRLVDEAKKNEAEYLQLKEPLADHIQELSKKQLELTGKRPGADSALPAYPESPRAQLEALGAQLAEDRKAVEEQIARIDAHFPVSKIPYSEVPKEVQPTKVLAEDGALRAMRDELEKAMLVEIKGQEMAYEQAMDELKAAEKKVGKELTRLQALQTKLDGSLVTEDLTRFLDEEELAEEAELLESKKKQTDRLEDLLNNPDNGIAPLAAGFGVDLGNQHIARGHIGEGIDELKSEAEKAKGAQGFIGREWSKFTGRVNMHRTIHKENGVDWDAWDPNPAIIGGKYKEDFKWLLKVGFPVNLIAGLLIAVFTIIGFAARIANVLLTITGAVAELGCRLGAKVLKKAGDLLSKPLDLVSKKIAIADKEGKVGPMIGWRAVAVLCLIPKALGSACNISSVALRTTGEFTFEACALAGKAAVLASRPWNKDMWMSTAFSVGKTISTGVSVVTGVVRQTGTEIREVGNKTNIPGVKHAFHLIGSIAQSSAILVEGATETSRQALSGHKELSNELLFTTIRTAWNNLDPYESKTTVGEQTGLTHKHLMKESREVKHGDEPSKLTKRSASAPEGERREAADTSTLGTPRTGRGTPPSADEIAARLAESMRDDSDKGGESTRTDSTKHTTTPETTGKHAQKHRSRSSSTTSSFSDF